MDNEIEQFLRRVARNRQANSELVDDVIIDAEILDTGREADDRREGVAEHVSHHLDTSTIKQHASQLGNTIEQSDDRLDSHLQAVFDHTLGDLGSTTSRTEKSTLDRDEKQAATVSQLIHDVRQLLAQPGSLKTAVLLSEILGTPKSLEPPASP